VKGEYANALLLPAGEALDVQSEDGFTSAIVPRFEIHAVVVFTP